MKIYLPEYLLSRGWALALLFVFTVVIKKIIVSNA